MAFPLVDCSAINCQALDAVKHLVLCQVEKRRPWLNRAKLDLDVYPFGRSLGRIAFTASLPKANVGTTSAASYMSLIRGQAA